MATALLSDDEVMSLGAFDDSGQGEEGDRSRGSSSDDHDEEVRGLWRIIEQKDADLRSAAQLGKMLVDQKEEDAEAHEGEKEALWRRIQEMARRVMELEQEAAELREITDSPHELSSSIDPSAAAGSGAAGLTSPRSSVESTMITTSFTTPGDRASLGTNGSGYGFGNNNNNNSSSSSSSIRVPRESVASRGAEERALRAKNEMLERQLAHMKEAAAETQLELEAAKKARFGRPAFRAPSSVRSSSIISASAAGASGLLPRSRGNSISLHALSPGSTRLASAGGAGGGVERGTSNCQSPSTPRQLPRKSRLKRRSSSGRGLESWFVSPHLDTSDEEDEDESDSEASEDALRTADRIHNASWRREQSGKESVEPLQKRSSSWGEVRDSSDDDETVGRVKAGADGHGEEGEEEDDTEWLMEQNAWLLEQLEAKDELIEELRAQLEEAAGSGQVGRLGRHSSPGNLSYGELGGALGRGGGLALGLDGSDDDSDDDHHRQHGAFGGGERSFLDELMDGDGEDAFLSSSERHYASRNRFPLEAMSKVDEEEDGGLLKSPTRPFGGLLADNALPGPGKIDGNIAALSSPNNRADHGNRSPACSGIAGKAAQSPARGREGIENSHAGGVDSKPGQSAAQEGIPDEKGEGEIIGGITGVSSRAVPPAGGSGAGGVGKSFLEDNVTDTPSDVAETDPSAEHSVDTSSTEPCSSQQSSPSAPCDTKVAEDENRTAAPVASVRSDDEEISKNILNGSSDDTVGSSDNRIGAVCPDVISGTTRTDAAPLLATTAAESVTIPSRTTDTATRPTASSPTSTITPHLMDTTCTQPTAGLDSSNDNNNDDKANFVHATIPLTGTSYRGERMVSDNIANDAIFTPVRTSTTGQTGPENDEGDGSTERIPVHTPNRAERKSRQAMDKLGLRAVPGGVFRMTMKASNGVVFVVNHPDVYKHPNQNTYVVFGMAETETPATHQQYHYYNNTRAPRAALERRRSSDAARRRSSDAAAAAAAAAASVSLGSEETKAIPSRPDPALVETKSVHAGLDPADVLTIVSHVGCTPDEAIAALHANEGDVVNAVLALT